ncbi:MAG: tetratricopeptide repeat protein [Flavobacteriia bacterium]|jgi:tetratricopeptide (TPR) repeat protein|nr:tetratricopeptide repeat protein [Cryomorphaceae bacterium]
MKRLGSIVLIIILTACGTAKKSTDGFSTKDFPFIERFHEGVRLKMRGQINDAIIKFEECIMIRPDDAAYYALSECYLMKNDLARSAEYIKMAVKLDPKNIWYTQELAYMYFESGNFAEAVKNFEKLVKYAPQNVEWLYGYAECLMKVGKIDEAIKSLDKMEEQVGKHPELAMQKFNLYLQIKQVDKAINEIEKARKEFPEDPQLLATLVDFYFQTGREKEAITMLEALVKSAPENGRARLALADIYRQKGRKQDELLQLKAAFSCEDVDLDTKMKILIGIYDKSSKIDQEVYDLVDALVAQYPNEAKSHSIKGDYLLRAEKDIEALESYREALKYDKNQYPIWNQVLLMEYQEGKFEWLYEDSKTCMEYFPSIPTVYLLSGVSAVQLKKFDEAITVLETGKELIVGDKALEAEMYGQLGEAYFGIGKTDEGKEAYGDALKMDPESSLLRTNYANRLALSKIDLGYALELIDAVLKENPTVPEFLDTKGLVLFQLNLYADALTFFKKADELKPSDKIIVEHLGDAYSKSGDALKAVEFWIKAKELGSTSKNLDKKIEKKTYFDPTN